MSKDKKKKQPDPEKKLMDEIEQNTVPEETPVPENSENTEAETEPAENSLQQELDQANAKVAEYLSMAQRIQADFENFRKRNENVRSDAYADGKKDVAAAMLPVLDNLERAVEAASGSGDESLKNGVALVLKQMIEVYQKLEVSPINRLGEKLHPNLQHLILQGAAEDREPGTVCQVLQKGYRMGDKVLRHAMVKVVPE